MASSERDYFAGKAAAVLADPNYEQGLRDEQEATQRELRRQRATRLRRLAVVAMAALDGDYGPEAQKNVEAALQAFGDVRVEVSALARWDEAHRKGEPPFELDKPLLRQALDGQRVESSLRGVEALAREVDRERRKNRKAGRNG